MFLEICTLKHSQTYSWVPWPSITDYLSISAGYGHNLPAIVGLTIEDSLEKLEMHQVSNRRIVQLKVSYGTYPFSSLILFFSRTAQENCVSFQ